MDLFSLDRPLEPPEILQVIAKAILTTAESGNPISVPNLVNPEACGIMLGYPSQIVVQFGRLNRETFSGIANTHVNRLISANILQRDWTQGGSSNLFLLSPERSASLDSFTTLVGVSTYAFVETLDDDVLRTRCEAAVLAGSPPDSLLREAATVLEDRLRNHLPINVRVDRRGLPAKVLHHDSALVTVSSEEVEQDDFFFLVRGIIGYYGTSVHHGLKNIPPKTARRVISIIDEVLTEMSRQPKP